jgi:hypothetical protein
MVEGLEAELTNRFSVQNSKFFANGIASMQKHE